MEGTTVYLAGGAVVKGAIIARNADHIRICGRGILDGTDWPWLKGPAFLANSPGREST